MPEMKDFPEFIRALPEVKLPYPGCRGWLIQGLGQQVIFIGFDRTTEVPEHSHAEQWEFVLAGEVAVHREGASSTYHVGDHFFIPAGIRHAAVVAAGYRALMIFNSSNRYEKKEI
jgi:quercetin dioxygenase-like cupin family protein